MISREEFTQVKEETLAYFKKANIVLTDEEIDRIEVADFGLNRINEFGLQLIEYVNTERCCAKDLVLLPHQTCPEHLHPPVKDSPGKEETFRCRFGTVYLYVPGPETTNPKATIPVDKQHTFTVWNEIVLNEGEQYTLEPNTPHWFQAGEEGSIISEFSTKSTDENDIFTDEEIKRIPVVK
ncbi:D-lyxose/D-mannose family sugar isomerase [Guptibacillus hwajinpoensis]|uniref:D-lyxose ketol-isomerase n=1 Tax=Guptibacillus hwajinpoensis TaxID=208199 RepID=A0ABU0JZE5_9BACL|nr:D-lyxose/D-mannose family sugar isomerase [Alkalihalobacillus hemicentroti]MDQ0482460.1 D-lyxose ketol-isomerase [Alkalihalobacillus hemicentroti]